MATLNSPKLILEAIAAQFAVIRKVDGFNTDIGLKIYLVDQQRGAMSRPSIAIGVRSGTIDRTSESVDGRSLSARSRALDFVIEAAVESTAERAQLAALDMLEDIESAFARKSCGAPVGVTSIRLVSWGIPDRPDGIDVAILQVAGTADYSRT